MAFFIPALALGAFFLGGCAPKIFSHEEDPPDNSDKLKEGASASVIFRKGELESQIESSSVFSLPQNQASFTSYRALCPTENPTEQGIAPWFSSGIKNIEKLKGKEADYIWVECKNSNAPSSILFPSNYPNPLKLDQVELIKRISEIEPGYSITLGTPFVYDSFLKDDYYQYVSNASLYVPFVGTDSQGSKLGIVEVTLKGKRTRQYSEEDSEWQQEMLPVSRVLFREPNLDAKYWISLGDNFSLNNLEWLGQGEDPYGVGSVKKIAVLALKETKKIGEYDIPQYRAVMFSASSDKLLFKLHALPQVPDPNIFGVHRTAGWGYFHDEALQDHVSIYYSNPVFNYDFFRNIAEVWIAGQPVFLQELKVGDQILKPHSAPATFFRFYVDLNREGEVKSAFFPTRKDGMPGLGGVATLGKRKIGSRMLPVAVGIIQGSNLPILSGNLYAYVLNPDQAGPSSYERLPLTDSKTRFPFLPFLTRETVGFKNVDPTGSKYFSGISIDFSSIPPFQIQTGLGKETVSSDRWNEGIGLYARDVENVALYQPLSPTLPILTASSQFSYQSTLGILSYGASLIQAKTFPEGLERQTGNIISFYAEPSGLDLVFRGVNEFLFYRKNESGAVVKTLKIRNDESFCKIDPKKVVFSQLSSSSSCMQGVGNPYFSPNGYLYIPVDGSLLKVSSETILN